MRKSSWGISLGFLALVASGCGSSGSEEKVVSQRVQSSLDQLLSDALKELQIPGIALGVRIAGSEPYFTSAGINVLGETSALDWMSRMRVGSVSKNFVAVCILQMAAEGKLSLDDTLEQWLPGKMASVDGQKVTLRMLLSHRSGLESYTDDETMQDDLYRDPKKRWAPPDQFIEMTNELHAKAVKAGTTIAPDSVMAYSNSNYVLLATILEKIDGKPVADVIKARIVDRLGLKDTFTPSYDTYGIDGSPVHGYVNWVNFRGVSYCAKLGCTDALVDATEMDVSVAYAAGTMVSSVVDLMTYLEAEVKGDLISSEMRAQQQAFVTAGEHYPGLEVGLGMMREPKYGIIGHRGQISGFDATMQYVPEHDISITVIANRTPKDNEHVGAIVTAALDIIDPTIKKP